jgi:hypothetical protein
VADTLYADISEWQVGVNDTYPYPVLCIRSNDGDYRDRRWVNNYGWCLRNVDSGQLTFFIVYFVWRPNWQETVETFKSQVRSTSADGGDDRRRVVGWTPFGRCDMNAADGLTAQQSGQACGISPVLPVELAARRRRALLDSLSRNHFRQRQY